MNISFNLIWPQSLIVPVVFFTMSTHASFI